MADDTKGIVLRMVPKLELPATVPAADTSPEAMLVDLLERVRAGWRPQMMVVHAIHEDQQRPGASRLIYWSYGVANHLEHLGVLDLARYSLLTETK